MSWFMQPELLKFLDKRIPRYTSYPTAVQFRPDVDGATYQQWLATLPADLPLSIYLHVPFCAELCFYCGCHTTAVRRYAPIAAYAELVEREIALVGQCLGDRRTAVHVHWGGGTPTMLSPQDFSRLTQALKTTFALSADAEMAIEIDPRTLTQEMVQSLAEAGITRASLGVQDFEERVQKAVGRLQSFEQTACAADWLRAAGIVNINFDLMYGLPYQTVETMAATVRRALTLDPDRIALFGYAHVPWMKRHQNLMPEDALPGPVDRVAQFSAAAEVLTEAAYRPIGLDHFAKHDDGLARCQQEKRIHRNFQGYTTDEAATLIGFGASSIGALPQGYVQNAPSAVAYRTAIEADQLATTRGCALSGEDRLRRAVIEQLMCNLEVNLAEIAAKHHRSLADFKTELDALDALAAHGLVQQRDGVITVPEHARTFVRSVCAVFDAYLSNEEVRYSRAV